MTVPQVAEATGINLNTVYSRLRAAKKCFATLYARERLACPPSAMTRHGIEIDALSSTAALTLRQQRKGPRAVRQTTFPIDEVVDAMPKSSRIERLPDN